MKNKIELIFFSMNYFVNEESDKEAINIEEDKKNVVWRKFKCPYCGETLFEEDSLMNGTEIPCYYCETEYYFPIFNIKDLEEINNNEIK